MQEPTAALPLPPPAPPATPAASAPAVAVPAAPASVPLSQLPAAVVSALGSGEGIVIDLSPADLGRMRIELPATSGAVEVRLVVEKSDTLPLVRLAAETLADDLRQAGIMAQTVTVELLAADRADAPRAEAGGGTSAPGTGAAAGGDRAGLLPDGGGSGAWRGSRDGAGRDGAGAQAGMSGPVGDAPGLAGAERLDLRL